MSYEYQRVQGGLGAAAPTRVRTHAPVPPARAVSLCASYEEELRLREHELHLATLEHRAAQLRLQRCRQG
jgi:hypothetical protein